MNADHRKAVLILAELGKTPRAIVQDPGWHEDEAPTLAEVNNVLVEPQHRKQVNGRDSNRRRLTNHFLTLDGVTRTEAEWSAITGIGRSTICMRIKAGWSVRDTLTVPVKIVSQEYRHRRQG
jgi:hypothetical protein